MNLMLYLRDVLVLLVGTRVLLRALQSNALALRVARLGRVLRTRTPRFARQHPGDRHNTPCC